MKRILKLIQLGIRFFFDLVRANVALARQLLSPRLSLKSEIIEIETDVSSPAEILALSNMITSIPGTLTLEIEPGKKLVVHVLGDAEDAAAAIREHLEEPLLEVTRKSVS